MKNLRALEASVIPSTVVENYAQGDWDVEVDAKDVSLQGSAKACSNFKISKTFNQVAAWEGWW